MSAETVEAPVDVEGIMPEIRKLTIAGVPCMVNRLKTREFLALMRVLTAGLGSGLGQVSIDFSDAESVGRDLSALMLLAVPNAFDEFVQFLGTVVSPVDMTQRAVVGRYLADNPELDELLEIFEAIAVQEQDDLVGLAGKAQTMWKRIVPLYQMKMKTLKSTPT